MKTRTAAPAVGSLGFVSVGGGGFFAAEVVSSRFGRLTVRMAVACRYFGPAGSTVVVGACSWVPAASFWAAHPLAA